MDSIACCILLRSIGPGVLPFSKVKRSVYNIITSISTMLLRKLAGITFLFCTASCSHLSDEMMTQPFDLPMHVALKREWTLPEIKKALPIKLEETRYLTDIQINPDSRRITQFIVITNTNKDVVHTNFRESVVKKAFTYALCLANKKNFQRGFNDLEFIYIGNDNREIVRIFLSDAICRGENALP